MTFTFLQRVLRNRVKGKTWAMVSTVLSITPPHLGRTASPSPGEDSTSPAGTHTPTLTPTLTLTTVPTLPHLSPIEVKVSPEAGPQKVRAWGPGLEGGVVGKSADFVVEALGEDVGTLGECGGAAFPVGGARSPHLTFLVCPGFSVEGPSQAKIECDDKGDGSCDVRYWPTEPGEYAVHVLCNNQDIQHSPFMADITPPPSRDFYPDKVSSSLTPPSCCSSALTPPSCCSSALTPPVC